MTGEPRFAFMGGATIYQNGQKFDVDARLWALGAETPARSFLGEYRSATPAGLESGTARIRFSDGSEAEAALVATEADRGRFRISGYLESTEELMRETRRARGASGTPQ
jgi:hypothetical protein